MSVFGIRKALKSGIKKVLNNEGADTAAPNWQNRKAEEVYRPQKPAPAAVAPVAEATPEAAAPVEAAPVEVAPVAVAPEVVPPVEAAPEAPVAEEVAEEVAETPAMAESDDTAGPAINFDDVQEILDDMVRPALQGDGGDITLLKIEDNSIYVKLVGACSTCPSSIMTMKMGVEALLKEEFPAMVELVQVD